MSAVVRVAVCAHPLDAAALTPGTLVAPAHGAIASFIGVVRDQTLGHTVVALDYQVYPAMAERVFAALIAEAAAEHDEGLRASIVHGSGPMGPGDAVVAIHVASAHRAAAFAACRQLIERIKEDAPIWKHERYADGEARWIHGS